MSGLSEGQGATCIHCKAPIKYHPGFGWGFNSLDAPEKFAKLPAWAVVRNKNYRAVDPDGCIGYINGSYQGEFWYHLDTDDERVVTCPKSLGDHKPREFCSFQLQRGGRCHKPTDRDNWLDELYACGVHTRAAREQRDDMVRRQKAQREREEAEQIKEWKTAEVKKCFEWLDEHGWYGIIEKGNYRYTDPDEGKVSIMRITEILQERGYDGPGASDGGEQEDMASIFEAEAGPS